MFLYLVTRETPVDFRAFLHRHAELFRALAEWELRLLVPRHLTESAPLFEAAARQELAMPLRLDDANELAWFFRQRRRLDGGGAVDDVNRFRGAVRQFHAPRFRAMYRLWKKEGDALVHATVSRVLERRLRAADGPNQDAGAAASVSASHPPGRLGVGGREREKGGTQTSGQCSPQLDRGRVEACAGHALRGADVGARNVVDSQQVAGTVMRGVLCRARGGGRSQRQRSEAAGA